MGYFLKIHHLSLMKALSWTKYAELLGHILALVFLFSAINVDWYESWWAISPSKGGVRLLSVVVFLLVFYANAFALLPYVLKKKGWLWYGASLVLMVLAVESIRALGAAADHESPVDLFFGLGHVGDAMQLGLAFSWGYFFLKDWIHNRRQIEQLEQEKLRAELALLKSQVDPHFLFNTLNSLYGLALEEGSTKTAEGIAQLGSLMRYSLEDAQQYSIPLTEELGFLKRYIALQELRATEQMNISVEWPEEEVAAELQVAPMLLQPLIENAFKYGMSSSAPSYVKLQISCQKGQLKCWVQNPCIQQAASLSSTGKGLQNLEERLALLYPNRHVLEYGKKNGCFTACLSLQLQSEAS
jgi:hypothetical protein